MGFYWVKPPSALATNIESWAKRIVTAVFATVNQVGAKMQGEARQQARWEDRTGNARSGIFYAVDGSGMGLPVVMGQMNRPSGSGTNQDMGVLTAERNTIVLVLSHTMWYGKFLELSNGGRYAIILSTMERNVPELERALRKIMS
jgi:hypothetical protein